MENKNNEWIKGLISGIPYSGENLDVFTDGVTCGLVIGAETAWKSFREGMIQGALLPIAGVAIGAAASYAYEKLRQLKQAEKA